MILVTGATGHLGAAVVETLLKTVAANEIVALVRDENKAAALKEKGIIVRIGNFHDTAALATAFEGVEKAILISSSDFNDRLGQHKNVTDAAKNAGVKHFVYTGVTMKDVNTSVLKDFMIDHYQTEDYIKESGLTYTFLENNLYADLIPMYTGEKVLETGIFFPAGAGKVPYALRSEMGEAAANVLTNAGHENKTYHISAGVSYTFKDIAAGLSDLSGKEITYTDADPNAFLEILKGAGVPEMMINISMGFSTAIKNGDFDVPSNDLETLLGRKPTDLKGYLKGTFFA